jgi:hypothetical protein
MGEQMDGKSAGFDEAFDHAPMSPQNMGRSRPRAEHFGMSPSFLQTMVVLPETETICGSKTKKISF